MKVMDSTLKPVKAPGVPGAPARDDESWPVTEVERPLDAECARAVVEDPADRIDETDPPR
jgi:hypothetical protein